MANEGSLEVTAQINKLVQGWMYRDISDWDRLASLFHPDATVEITWFIGTALDFIAGSQKMGASKLRTKHQIGFPIVDQRGTRAIAETSTVIVVEHQELGLACNGYARFYDYMEDRNGEWKIVERHCIYDLAAFTFPRGAKEVDLGLLDRFPSEYAALAYLLVSAGFPVDHVFPTRGSELERKLKSAGQTWLRDQA
jgi:hypothetical protein